MNPEALESGLSPSGLDRCAAMRAAMLDAFTAMHRARRRRRRASALAAALLLLGASAWLATHLLARPGSVGEVAGAGSLAPAARSLVQVVDGPVATVVVEFALVVDGGDSLVRKVDSAVSFVEVIGNDELVRTLAEMDRPAGLIAVGGRVRLTSPVVADGGEAPDGGGSRLDHPRAPVALPSARPADPSEA